MMKQTDDFYVGYLPLPARLKQFLLVLLPILLLLGAISAGVVSSQQRDPGEGRWEFGIVRTYEGLLQIEPYAMLRTKDAAGRTRTMFVVLEGKAGATEHLREVDGRYVQLRGSLLERDGRLMLELSLSDDAVKRIDANSPNAVPTRALDVAVATHGGVALKGEIIDPKCYLGAMKPGGGKTHKACATLCIRGGIPPMFVTRDADGRETYYLLTDETGNAIKEPILPYVGEPVELRGDLETHGDVNVIRVDRDGVSRL